MATSIGRGLSRNYKMPNFVPVWQREFAMQDRRKAQNAALKAKAQDSQDKALNKILDSDFKVDPNKFHPKFLPFVLEANRDAISKIREARNSGDPTWQNRVPEIVDKAVKETSLQLHNSQMAFAHEKAQDGKVYKSGQLSQSLNSNFGDLSDIPSDVSMGVSFNPETRSLVYQPQGVIDTRKLRQAEVFNDPKNYTQQQEVDGYTDAGQPTRKIINTIPDTGLANFNATLLRNPDYAFNISHEYAKEKGIRLPDDFKTNEDFGKDLAKWHFGKLQEERGKIIKDQLGSRAPRPPASETNKDLGLQDLIKNGSVATNVPMTIRQPGTGAHRIADPVGRNPGEKGYVPTFAGNESTSTISVPYEMPITLKDETIISNNKDIFDPVTNQYIKGAQTFTVKNGNIKFVPIKNKEGKFKPYVIVKANDYVQTEDGKTVTSTTNDIAIPFNQLENVISKSNNTKWVQEAQRELDNRSATGVKSNLKKSSSSNPKWKGGMKIRGKKSGKTYIWTGKDANDPNGFYAEE
jgi:hypothetical protein